MTPALNSRIAQAVTRRQRLELTSSSQDVSVERHRHGQSLNMTTLILAAMYIFSSTAATNIELYLFPAINFFSPLPLLLRVTAYPSLNWPS